MTDNSVNVVTKDDFEPTQFDTTNVDGKNKIKIKGGAGTIDFSTLQRVDWDTDTVPLAVRDGKLVLMNMDA